MDRHARALRLHLVLVLILIGIRARATGRVHAPLVPEPTRARHVLVCGTSRKVGERGGVCWGELEDRARGVDEDVGREDGEDELGGEGGGAA